MSDNFTTHSRQRERDPIQIKYSRIKRRILKHVWAVRIFFAILVFAVIGFVGLAASRTLQNVGVGNVANLAYSFVFGPVDRVASENGRTNILLMGKAGGDHEGADLTDTMLFVSISLTDSSITTVSIPRDIWIPEIRAKINSAYYWGNRNTPYFTNIGGGGIPFAKSITEEIVGKKIQYGVVIDFSAFKDTVDALGGVSVNVDRSFTDTLYPIAGRENDLCGGNDPDYLCRYETIYFDQGEQIMNGDTALKFVRSRHAEGIEGTDTARESRQQKVIGAIKEKLMDPKVFLSPKVALAMADILKKYVQTDIDGPTAAILARVGLKSDKNTHQFLIPEDLLINPPTSKMYDNQYVFIPKAGNGKWEEINAWVESILR